MFKGQGRWTSERMTSELSVVLFQEAQHSGSCTQRQIAYLVKHERSLIGCSIHTLLSSVALVSSG
jgi:hypothetical protein